MADKRLVLRDPTLFKDPANLTWERYVALQARERERYQAERAALPADALAFHSVSPRYLERAVEQFANNYFPEEAATRYIATAAARAPFEALKTFCLFQLADEQRHLEMDRDIFERAGIPERDWLPAWEQPGTTCRFFHHVMELEDSKQPPRPRRRAGRSCGSGSERHVREDRTQSCMVLPFMLSMPLTRGPAAL
jgi:hypothetical protein